VVSERLGGSAAEGEREGKRWGSGPGGAMRRGGAVGPSPDRRTAPGSGPSAALVGDVRRVHSGNREGREASDGWVATQYRAAVPLTGGAGLSAGVGRAWAWARSCVDARGLAREETETGRPDAQ
jgi:hypothetical protein